MSLHSIGVHHLKEYVGTFVRWSLLRLENFLTKAFANAFLCFFRSLKSLNHGEFGPKST
jgi:hypothetical protein